VLGGSRVRVFVRQQRRQEQTGEAGRRQPVRRGGVSAGRRRQQVSRKPLDQE
jgi:hypothetical protein